MSRATLYQGDCLAVMRELPAASIDAGVTDPPYGIGFMGREWDVFRPERVADRVEQRRRKGTEPTSDRWPDKRGTVQGGGPAIQYDESARGNQRFQMWVTAWAGEALRVLKPGAHLLCSGGARTYHRVTCGLEDAGWEIRDCLSWLYGSGFPKSHNGEWGGTALKPGWEPIILARKPLVSTVAANVAEHGTGGLNIDGCRIGTAEQLQGSTVRNDIRGGRFAAGHRPNPGDIPSYEQSPAGRWPANVVLSHTPECREVGTRKVKGQKPGSFQAPGTDRTSTNHHPTVKPLALMRWLCRLITPPGGTILDPFMGSGTTGCAAELEGFDFVGIEREAEYMAIARARLAHWAGVAADQPLSLELTA